jgi:hypothetical protein
MVTFGGTLRPMLPFEWPDDHMRPDREEWDNWTIVLPILWYSGLDASVTSQ